MLKWFGKSKKRIKELENDLKTMRDNVVFWKKMSSNKMQTIQEFKTDIEEERKQHEAELNKLRHKIEDQEMELNILYKYWKLDEEPDRELIVKVHTDHKVHELELRNMELERNLEMANQYLKAHPYQQSQLMNYNFLQSPYMWR